MQPTRGTNGTAQRENAPLDAVTTSVYYQMYT
jgi:hypothetical protein